MGPEVFAASAAEARDDSSTASDETMRRRRALRVSGAPRVPWRPAQLRTYAGKVCVRGRARACGQGTKRVGSRASANPLRARRSPPRLRAVVTHHRAHASVNHSSGEELSHEPRAGAAAQDIRRRELGRVLSHCPL
jgi:hypothetical protein